MTNLVEPGSPKPPNSPTFQEAASHLKRFFEDNNCRKPELSPTKGPSKIAFLSPNDKARVQPESIPRSFQFREQSVDEDIELAAKAGFFLIEKNNSLQSLLKTKEDQLAERQKALEQLEARQSTLDSDLSRFRAELDKANAQLWNAELDTQRLRLELTARDEQLKQSEHLLSAKERRRSTLLQEVETLKNHQTLLEETKQAVQSVYEEEVARLKAQIAELKLDNVSLQSQLDRLRSRRSSSKRNSAYSHNISNDDSGASADDDCEQDIGTRPGQLNGGPNRDPLKGLSKLSLLSENASLQADVARAQHDASAQQATIESLRNELEGYKALLGQTEHVLQAARQASLESGTLVTRPSMFDEMNSRSANYVSRQTTTEENPARVGLGLSVGPGTPGPRNDGHGLSEDARRRKSFWQFLRRIFASPAPSDADLASTAQGAALSTTAASQGSLVPYHGPVLISLLPFSENITPDVSYEAHSK